jgi:hypothetical protein
MQNPCKAGWTDKLLAGIFEFCAQIVIAKPTIIAAK